MDVKAGATVGFATAIGGLAGYMVGAFFGGFGGRESAHLNLGIAGVGALVGSFIGGTVVAPTPPPTAVAAKPPALLPMPPANPAASGTASPVMPPPTTFAESGR
jgi:hypothetical protein